MYGALLASVWAVINALGVIAPAVISWQLLAGVGLTIAFFVQCVSPVVAIGIYLAAECVFLLWLRRVFWRMNKPKPLEQRLQAPLPPQEVWDRTLKVVDLVASWRSVLPLARSPTEWLEGWFLQTPISDIRRGNMVEFLAWALYTKETSELTAAEREEVEGFTDKSAARYGWTFAPGYTPGVKPMRINVDKICAWCHPLGYYAGLYALRAATRSAMRLLGFTFHVADATCGISYYHCPPPPPPPGLLTQGGIPVQKPKPLPVVFIHGLGIGIMPYVPFFRRLAQERECIIVELPEVSQCCSEKVFLPTDMPEIIASVLRRHGHERACFAAHSYGTFVMSWILRARKDLVARLVLIDAVSLLLAQPDVAYNFLYRRPLTTTSVVMSHFVRWELYSANVLMRHFYWYHNVLWLEDLPDDAAIVLSANDDIVSSNCVRHYVEGTRPGKDRPPVKLLWLDGFFHGGILVSRAAQKQIMELL